MVSALLQPRIDSAKSQIAALKSQLSTLAKADSEATRGIKALTGAIEKFSLAAPDELPNLRQTILTLFDVGATCDSDNQGEQSRLFETGVKAEEPIGHFDPKVKMSLPASDLDEAALRFENATLDGPTLELEEELVGQRCELCCLVEDAPLQGQYHELTCERISNVEPVYKDSIETKPAIVEPVSINKVGDNAEAQDVFQLVNLTPSVAYFKRIDDGEIVATYAGFNSKAKAEQWVKWLAVHHSVASAFEIRPAKRLINFRYETKLWGMSLKQIERLTECDFTKTPLSNFGDASKRKPEIVAFAPKSFQVDSEVAAVMETEAKLEEAAVEEAIASIQPPETPAPAAPAYNPNPIGRRGAASNWKALETAGGLNLKAVGTGINNGAAAVIEEKETEASPEPQVFKIGDAVTITSARHGEDLLGLTGTIKIANPVGCVVDVASQTRWFCCDEIELLTDDFEVDF